MNKVLKDVVSGAIRLERFRISETEELKDLRDSKEINNLDKNVSDELDLLQTKVPKDVYRTILKLIDMKDEQINFYGWYYFMKGVISGLTNLDFLKKVRDIDFIKIVDIIGECEYEK